ncbi:MAG: formyltetrahydrofolate deformylase [Candidatus Eisenbacteria bacterium]
MHGPTATLLVVPRPTGRRRPLRSVRDGMRREHHPRGQPHRFLGRTVPDPHRVAAGRLSTPARGDRTAFGPLADELQATWELHFSDARPRIAIFVSRQTTVSWISSGGIVPERFPEIVFVAGNHEELAPTVRDAGIEFRHIPVAKVDKSGAEARQLELLEQQRVDLVVLAKYMQILSPDFVARAPRIINIHHSFLPAFVGAKPYHQALERGVKIIGATAHYVTPELDAGPIIEQDVTRVSHRDEISDLIRHGKDLERMVLARAVRLHLTNRVLVYGNRTVVFA